MTDVSRLPGPQIEKWDWQHEGSCRDLDTEMFFHPDGERGIMRKRRASAAKAVCSACPVVDLCREHAIETHEPYGIWGGLTEEERRLHIRLNEEQKRLSA